MKNKSQWPFFSKGEIKAVRKILESNKVNYLFGGEGHRFEKNFATFSDSKYALAVANGTLALDLCMRSIGISKNDEVIVTGRTFIASASCISILGGTPVFVDVDLNTQNINVESIKRAITKKTKAIICVHFAGFPCDMPEIMKIAKKNSLFVIEDCAQAHGAKINNRSVGSFGDINAWSFCNDKIMTTGGEGGMVTTNNKNLYNWVCSFNNHGKDLRKYYAISKKAINTFPLIHYSLGLNYRLTEMQSAIGNFQLNKMQSWTSIRNRNAEIIIKKLKNLDLIVTPNIDKKFIHAFYKLYLTIDPNYLKPKKNRGNILKELNKRGVMASFGSSGRVFAEKAFHEFKTVPPGLPNSSFLEKNSIMIQVHPTITKNEISNTASIIHKVLLGFQK